jgi:hypothetical protein
VIARLYWCQRWGDNLTLATQGFYPAFESKATNAGFIAEFDIRRGLLFDLVYHLLDVTSSILDSETDDFLVARIM